MNGPPPTSLAPNRTTFEAAYRAMVGFVRQVVYRQSIPRAQRDDAVQDVFLVAYRRWNQLDNAQNLRAWLKGIAVRTCWNYQRAHRRYYRFWMATPHEAPDDLPALDDRVVEQELARAEELHWLGEALARLDDKRKQALVLSRLEGHSAAEVSRMTGLSPHTVASRVRAALRTLRGDLVTRDAGRDRAGA